VSLNEVRIHESHLSALGDQFLERVIPKDGQSLILLVCLKCGLSGRSFFRQFLCLSSFCQKKVCRCEVHEIPKDGQSLIVLDGLSGLMSFCLCMVCQKKVGQFLECVIPKDGQNGKLAYARLLNRNRVNLNHESRCKKVYLTSSFFPGGRRLVLRCVAYLSTRALVRGHQILGHRRSFWCRALRGHLLCDEACDLLQF
jgi:hypothetical protein